MTQIADAVRSCPKRGQHKAIPGARCDGCGATIPVGPYTADVYGLYFDEALVSSVAALSAEEVGWRDDDAANWRRYAEAERERQRLNGEITKIDRELSALRTEALNTPYTQGKVTTNRERATAAELQAKRAELVEARVEAIAASEKVLRDISKVAAEHEVLRRRRLAAAPVERPGLAARVARALR